jgi:hypothetical protein
MYDLSYNNEPIFCYDVAYKRSAPCGIPTETFVHSILYHGERGSIAAEQHLRLLFG